MQFGVCARPEDAAWIKDLGAEFVEGHVQQFLRPGDESWAPAVAKGDLAIPVAGYNCFFPGDMKITGPHMDLGRIAPYAKRACERCAAMGSDFIVFGSGAARMIPEGWPRERAEAQIVEVMKTIGPLAAEADITVTMEHLNSPESNLLNSLVEGLDYIGRADAPGISILCDLFHFTLMKEPLESLDGCRRLLTHVHIAEPQGRVAPSPEGMDYKPFFAKLKEIGYDDRISIECSWHDMKAELEPCLAFLRKEWAAA